eukprot:scaffold3165_cov62-Cyclotella_meneghiniana.AAC.13
MGEANDNCCHCKNAIAHIVPATEDSSLSSTCVDTPRWKNTWGGGCGWYEEWDLPGCPKSGFDEDVGARGPASDHCCCCKDLDYGTFEYHNSPSCYCDFYNYALREFDHKLKSKSIDVHQKFNNTCEDRWYTSSIIEKYCLDAIYEATNGQNWTVNDGWMSNETDYCDWHGITCNSENFVTKIELNDNNLVGQFPLYTRYTDFWGNPELISHWQITKYGLARLYKLQVLDLANNKLTGTIDYGPLYNLEELTKFDVSGNQLIGEIEALVAPSVKHVDFSNNGFTAMRFKTYRRSYKTLIHFDVSNNAIKIKKDAADFLQNIPPGIEQLYASNNIIYGNLPRTLNGLSELRKFYMASNALSGTLPAFSEPFTTLQELDVSSNQKDAIVSNRNMAPGLSGSIPEDTWRFLYLKILNLAGNRLEGTVSPFFGDLALLEVFNLSNNLLVSSIPPQLGLLEGSLKHLDLSNNKLTGVIPSQLGQLQGYFSCANCRRSSDARPVDLVGEILGKCRQPPTCRQCRRHNTTI